MGVVYRAQDDRLGREVAIKALPPEVAADPVRLERFEREAKSLASVSSQHIAGIYGVEEQDGQRFLILELVEGESLADRLDRGPIGVEAAHEAGVVHRDLKPDNIQVTPDGIIKVLDFGLARSDEGQTSSGMGMSQMETQITLRQQTTPGAVLGTAAYMSPEQARGRRVDKRTDIWAFGVVLFEMLTGANPFSGETATDSIGAVLHKDPDLSSLPVSIPIGVRRVLSRCLEPPLPRHRRREDRAQKSRNRAGGRSDCHPARPLARARSCGCAAARRRRTRRGLAGQTDRGPQ